MTLLSTVDKRTALKPRRDPYWHRLSKGCYLGFRKMTTQSEGTWLARLRDHSTAKQEYKALGDFSTLPQSRRFDEAKKLAEAWFTHMGAGGINTDITIAEVCAEYIAFMRTERSEKTAKDVEARFANYVLSNKRLASTKLANLKPKHLSDWRAQLQQQPTRSGPNRGKRRTDSTLNRDMTCLRAALNHAKDLGATTSDFAWTSALRPIKDAERQRDAYLDRTQRQALINAAAPDLAAFLKALCQVPIRPGALACLTVASFNPKLMTLAIDKDKSGKHVRTIALPENLASFFGDCAKDKLPAAPLLQRADGKQWNKDSWKEPIRLAVSNAGLPIGTTAYTLRHSAITDLVHDGIDLLTVAQLAGTSLRMIEKHYGHLTGGQARKALLSLAL